jgi:DNA-binding GntR family transcriptional regulator
VDEVSISSVVGNSALDPSESIDATAPSLVRRSSGDHAAYYIRRLIFDGKLRPGTRVAQDEIARTLGVSRIPVREALIALEHEGWVTNHLHRGTFVNTLDENTVRDHYRLFGLVYGFAARMAIDRSRDGLVSRLSTIHNELLSAGEAREVARLTLQFHATVVDAAESPPTSVVLRAMSGLVPGNFFTYVPKATELERRGLTAVLRAIRAGDGDRAASAYEQMLLRQSEQVVILFRQRGLFDTEGPAVQPRRRARRRADQTDELSAVGADGSQQSRPKRTRSSGAASRR